MPNNTLYITALEKIADIMDFKGENVFKVSAFRNAASVLEGLTGEIDGLYKSGELASVKGIGKGILAVVEEIYTTGESATLKTLSEDVPDTVFDLFSLRGLGSKKIQALYHDKGVVSVEGLEEALSNGRLDDVKGFSAGFKDKLLEEISRFRKNSLYIRADKAEERGAQILNDFKNFCVKISETGQLRRKTEIVSCLEFVAL
ncbi:MAG: DNA polymerase/3'-5' exonuclease PolX, partial [Ignavibacteriaceae bacterium]|nr:DNA polymerase/3'-5' exonuclease PolX [Ignavibacteriaceae bacterium]